MNISFCGTLLIGGFLLFSCSYKVEKIKEERTKPDGASLSFAQVSGMALAPKCARCHGWATSYAGAAAVAFGDNGIMARVQSNTPGFQMPPASSPQLSANEKAAIVAWVMAGAKEFSGSPPSPVSPPVQPAPPPATPLNFEQVRAKVFTRRCQSCHGAEFETFESTARTLRDIEFRIQDTGGAMQMPPEGSTQLSDEEKNLVLAWIRAGAPND